MLASQAHSIGIIPAYAGSTVEPSEMLTAQKDHPRIRGEHFRSVKCVTPGPGSSPHTRGAPPPSALGSPRRRIIPAYAGSTRLSTSTWHALTDHPRIRGEHRRRSGHAPASAGSSPHTRGALYGAEDRRTGCRIIPAYAGSTRPPRQLPGPAADHPRIRGEHSPNIPDRGGCRGSSPHTRGAPVLHVHCVVLRRIIPAYAGSTHLGTRRCT